MKKKRKFPKTWRFFNPHKTGTNELRDTTTGLITRYGTHQAEKAKDRSYIPRIHQAKPGQADDGRRRKSEVCRTNEMTGKP